MLEVTGDTRWLLLGDTGKLLQDCCWLLGGYWEVTGGDCSPGSHLCLPTDLGIEEAVLTLEDGLGGAPQHLNLQTPGQGPAQRDSLSRWLQGPLQTPQHLGTEGRTPQLATPPGFSPWPLVSGFPGDSGKCGLCQWVLGAQSGLRVVAGQKPRHPGSQWGGAGARGSPSAWFLGQLGLRYCAWTAQVQRFWGVRVLVEQIGTCQGSWFLPELS